MPKFPLLLLDAGIVIGMHELGIWDKFIESCSVTLTSTVARDEVVYWEDDKGEKHYIDIHPDIDSGRIQCVDVTLSTIKAFLEQFDPSYLEKLDDGEAESLAFLYYDEKDWLISSSDGIVFKVLGRLGRAEKGISLEEILQQVGLSHSLHCKYTRSFRERYTRLGQQDSITGRGLK